jgi:hypothetical protein
VARLWTARQDPRRAAPFVASLERGLRYLTYTQYDHFLGQFLYTEDHWTCLAADFAWDLLDPSTREGYSRFCDGFGEFIGRAQVTENDSIGRAHPDFIGAYTFSPLLAVHTTPVGSRGEALVAVLEMDRRRGAADVLHNRAQLERGLRFLLGRQLRAEDALHMADPAGADGGFLMSDVARYVRIDFPQHGGAALLRAARLFE